MVKILIADDNQELCSSLTRTLTKRNFNVECAYDGESAINKIENDYFDIVLSDLRLPKADGMEVLRQVKAISPLTYIIMITAYGTVENAVEALHHGAFDYILKPFSIDEIEIKINKAIEKQRLNLENQLLKETLQTKFGPIITKSSTMKDVDKLIDKVAETHFPVLITGESGTGKEHIAREIHNRGPRKEEPFVSVNCIALSGDSLEEILFGSESESQNGSLTTRQGKIDLANSGTLFLDEIADLDPNVQLKLLRFLQEKDFQRLRGSHKIQKNVRLIAATNKDTSSLMKHSFNEDLLYRLKSFTINTPPLRERTEDMPDLVDELIKKHSPEFHKKVSITPEVIGILKSYNWPGNVRELENSVVQAIIMAEDDKLESKHFSYSLGNRIPAFSKEIMHNVKGLSAQIDAIEAEIIRQALEEANWNQSKAARELDIKRTSLQYKINKYGLAKKA